MNHPELFQKLTNLQTSLWPSVMNQVGEATGQLVQMNSPLVLESQVEELLQEFATPAALVQFSYAGHRDTIQTLILPLETAAALYSAMGGEAEEMDDAALAEMRPAIEAIVQGICLGLGNARNEIVVASDLSVRVGRFVRPALMQPSDSLVRIQLAIGVDATIGSLTWLLDDATAHFVAGLSQPTATQAAPVFAAMPSFGTSQPIRAEEGTHGLDILMDIPLDISVELGRTSLVVKEVVDLGVGSIVEIDKAAGEPVDILVNGRLVARGEVVVIEDNFGVRITEILNPRERLARLGEAA